MIKIETDSMFIIKTMAFTLPWLQGQSGSISSDRSSDWLLGNGSMEKLKCNYSFWQFYSINSLPICIPPK